MERNTISMNTVYGFSTLSNECFCMKFIVAEICSISIITKKNYYILLNDEKINSYNRCFNLEWKHAFYWKIYLEFTSFASKSCAFMHWTFKNEGNSILANDSLRKAYAFFWLFIRFVLSSFNDASADLDLNYYHSKHW